MDFQSMIEEQREGGKMPGDEPKKSMDAKAYEQMLADGKALQEIGARMSQVAGDGLGKFNAEEQEEPEEYASADEAPVHAGKPDKALIVAMLKKKGMKE